MSNLEEFLNNKLPEEQDDLFMREIAKRRMEGKRQDYEQKLKEKYSVSKEVRTSGNGRKVFYISIGLAILIGLLYLLLSPRENLNSTENQYIPIASYIENNKVHNYDIVRGDEGIQAHQAYQKGNYKEAILLWEKEEMDAQNRFYLSMAYLYSDQYRDAESSFSTLNKLLKDGDRFYPEQQLYWVLSLELVGKDVQAQNIRESWPSDSWMTTEYRKIMSE